MEPPKDIEAWADALLDEHRTAPAGSARRAAEDKPTADDLFAGRLASKLMGENPDPLMLERWRAAQERHQRLQKYNAIVWILAIIVACVFGFAWLDMV